MTDFPDAPSVLRLLASRPRLLALGEPTHGDDVLLDLRNDLFRQLVEQQGYRTIAIESDCLMGLLVDEYVTAGTGELDEVMGRGFSHEWGAFAGNRELVRWMRAFNTGRPAYDQVRFAGCDGPLEITGAASPRPALLALQAAIDPTPLSGTAQTLDRLLGSDDRWTNPAAMMDPAQSVGQTPEAGELRLLAGDLAAKSTSDRARLYARTAVGLLRYHFWMADTSPNRMERLLAQRDAMIAGNLIALAEQGPTLVSAHNSHLRRDKSTTWSSAGSIVAGRLGDEYAFLATALGTLPSHGVDAPPPGTVEGLLYALPPERCLVDPRRLPATLAPRVSPWYGYAPLNPAHLADIDGIVFVKDAR